MSDIMADLETLDIRPTSIILSIGACLVNWHGDFEPDPKYDFYRVISVESCKEAGLTESVSTRKFWDAQPEEARRVFTDPNVSLLEGLTDFANYLRTFNSNKVRVWGNGSDFDNTILVNAYDRLGLNAPWRFYNNRCFRTVRKTFSHLIQEPERTGTHHNALDDAKFQARILGRFGKHLGGVPG